MPPEESLYPADWLSIAEKDLRRVRTQLNAGDAEAAGFFLQQAIEKFLKAYLLSKGWNMKHRNVLLFVLAPLAATSIASCSCGNPTQPQPAPRGGAATPGSYSQSRHALTATTTTDTDFLTANRGYGIVEDTSVSAGNIRRTLGLPNFGLANVNPTVDGWQKTTTIATARESHASIVHNGYAYVIGGYNGSPLNDVQFAKINADGSFGTWSTTTNLPTGILLPTVVSFNNFIYVLGGGADGNFNDDVLFAKINADGTIGQWLATESFTTGRYAHTSFVHNGRIYLAGGANGQDQQLKDIQFASIRLDTKST